MRQLRAMRSTAASISTGVLHSREGPSSPRGSPDTDLGDMALSSSASASASGEGGLPHQLTSSPSMRSTPRGGEQAGAGTTEGSNDRANSAEVCLYKGSTDEQYWRMFGTPCLKELKNRLRPSPFDGCTVFRDSYWVAYSAVAAVYCIQ